jgi:hypothetical protein
VKDRGRRQALDKDLGGDFVGKGQDWIYDAVQLTLKGFPDVFELLQAPFLF